MGNRFKKKKKKLIGKLNKEFGNDVHGVVINEEKKLKNFIVAIVDQ